MTNQEKFIPTLEKIDKKIQADIALDEHEKVYLSAVISNQINVQHGYADIISYDEGIDIYGFEKEITYTEAKAS